MYVNSVLLKGLESTNNPMAHFVVSKYHFSLKKANEQTLSTPADSSSSSGNLLDEPRKYFTRKQESYTKLAGHVNRYKGLHEGLPVAKEKSFWTL